MWIRTHNGRLVNLSQFSQVAIASAQSSHKPWQIEASEPAYCESTPNTIVIATFRTREEVTEAMNDLYDWIGAQVGGVGCDFAAN